MKRVDFRRYELIAFITGFSLMAYELVSSRILAPTIGSSIYVWTSVIGVIIAALSLGFAVGGRIADRRVEELDVAWLLLTSALAVVLTLSASPAVLQLAVRLSTDARLQGVFASIFLFAPTSFLLGMISPYLARLKNVSVRTTGTTIASLSALNALGGIIGTFCVGFIFFAYLGARESLFIVGGSLMLSSWLIQPRQNVVRRIILSVWVIVLAVSSGIAVGETSAIATIDTPTATYQVTEYIRDGKSVRGLATGPAGLQSAVYRDGSKELVFAYARSMAEVVSRAPQKKDLLVLGGGAFTLPQYLAETYPGSHVDVVEIDPKLVEIARQYYNYRDPRNVTVITQDARVFLNENTKKYDVILVDVYSELQVPFSVSTVQYTGKLKEAAKPDGLVIANIIGSKHAGCGDLLDGLHRSYSLYFPYHRAYPMEDPSLRSLQNIVVAYSTTELSWLPNAPVSLGSSLAPKFTDNYAPVEHLRQKCSSDTASSS